MTTHQTDTLVNEPSPEDLALDYLGTIQTWCIKRKARRKQVVNGAPSPRAFDVLQAQAIMDCAREDLPAREFDALRSVVEHYRSSSRRGGTTGETYPPTAWSMYYVQCVLCDSTKRRHFRGGKCTGCWRATHELRSRVESLQHAGSDKPTNEET